jgi:hypothetical protein
MMPPSVPVPHLSSAAPLRSSSPQGSLAAQKKSKEIERTARVEKDPWSKKEEKKKRKEE